MGDVGKLLITGAAGFIGTNAAAHFASRGWQVTGLDNLARPGSERNLEWLRQAHPGVRVVRADVTDAEGVAELVAGHDAVLHLAAQVAVTTSLLDPRADFEVNAKGTLNVLEAVRRRAPGAILLYASTNKVYGAMEGWSLVRRGARWEPVAGPRGVTESEPLDLHSPYGCSKGAADQYVHDYGRCYGLRTFVFRQSCIYGRHQRGTEDQGWVAHFALRLLSDRPVTVYGDGAQVRDLLDVRDLCAMYESALDARVAGRIYNVGGGPGSARSVLEVLAALERLSGRRARVEFADWRQGDQRWYVSDLGRVQRELRWQPDIDFERGLRELVEWLRGDLAADRRPRVADLEAASA
ncbi:MAG: NAD-dependent epimerase/dehydratase family protein [Chloroflexi bacterium]|nr:MAG: NAD-dependent epimerase/dehydratase family protein [Chloroflexota bacterium]